MRPQTETRVSELYYLLVTSAQEFCILAVLLEDWRDQVKLRGVYEVCGGGCHFLNLPLPTQSWTGKNMCCDYSEIIH